MYDGTIKKVEDIQVGELVMGPDSSPREVLQTHKGKHEVREIIPQRGETWTATSNHLLVLHRYIRPMKAGVRISTSTTEIVPVEVYERQAKSYKHCSKMYRVGVEFPEKELPIDPYVFGLWLGDGHSSSPTLTCMDEELSDTWYKYADSLDLNVRIESNGSKAYTYHLTTRGTSYKKVNPFTIHLRELGVWSNKHIPHIYKTASREQRLQLLAGIVDTDGHTQTSGSIEITVKQETFSKDIQFLARSLGYSASIYPKKVNQTIYHRVQISGQTIFELPVKLKRKIPTNSKSNQNHYAFETRNLGVQDYAGITVDKDNLYLLGDFTVTHNTGKSAISLTISRWASSIRVAKKKDAERGRVGILASNNMLVDQYLKDYPSLQVLHASHRYTCTTTGVTIKERKEKKMGLCHPAMRCFGCMKYKADSTRIWSAPYALLNYHMYFAYKFFKHFNVVVVDEAHNLINLLQDLGSRRVFQHTLPKDFTYPDKLNSVQDMKRWLDSIPDEIVEESSALQHFKRASDSNKYMFREGIEEYRNEPKHCLKLIPIDLTEEPQMFFPENMRKIVLMSATISAKDVEQMGLYRRKVSYISAPSPIPAENRPILSVNPGLNMSYKYQDANMPQLAQMIDHLLEMYPDSKGLIHAPYSLAWKIKSHLHKHPRLMFHDKDNKMQVYKQFRESTEPKVLVASGMYEGVDLPYDAARFQAITKMPYPSLADPAVAFKADRDHTWYSWETLKQMLQACGRVVRAVDDYGSTYMLDNSFNSLYAKNLDNGLIPEWFQEAVQTIGYTQDE